MSWISRFLRGLRRGPRVFVSTAPKPMFEHPTFDRLTTEMHAHNERTIDTAMGIKPRCESRKREGSRSWRCTKDAGHPPVSALDGGHFNLGGGRRW